MTIKRIYQNNKLYLLRLSFPIKSGTIKIHVILQDDIEDLHTHPWDYSSLLIIPYKEEFKYTKLRSHGVLTFLRNRPNTLLHRVQLYKIFGISIPAITIGKYGHKKELCSFCKKLGYCKTERK